MFQTLQRNGSIKLDYHYRNLAEEKLSRVRIDLMIEYMSVFNLTVENDHFVKLTQHYMDLGNFGEATKCIATFDLFKKFDMVELCMQLVEKNQSGMLNRILDKVPEIRMSVISMLLKPQYIKIAIKLVAEYNFDPE